MPATFSGPPSPLAPRPSGTSRARKLRARVRRPGTARSATAHGDSERVHSISPARCAPPASSPVSAAHHRLDLARHLAQRAGFAERPAKIVQAAEAGHADSVAALFAPPSSIADASAPGWTARPAVSFKAIRAEYEDEEPKRLASRALAKAERSLIADLRAWWLATLIVTEDPLGARMTLFWQNHFTSGHRKVRHATLLLEQQKEISRRALGGFRDLLVAMLTDPAMLLYLDANRNRKARPNENLARELLELFTLGEGHYSERDVRETARALTGLSVDDALSFRFRPGAHDPDDKTILGTTGPFFGVEPIADAILARPAAARRVATKLWVHLVSPDPDADTVEDWTRAYRDSGHDTGALVHRILTSEAFLDRGHRGLLVKSPIEYVVGSHRALALPPSEGETLVGACLSMQQAPYEPPNVAGWPGGRSWINSQTLLARTRFVNRLVRDDSIDPAALVAGLDHPSLAATLVPESELAPELRDVRLERAAAADRSVGFEIAGLLGSPLWHLA